jgi:phage-related protein
VDTFTPAKAPSINGAASQTTPLMFVAEMGDGYSQRVQAGMQPERESLVLRWDFLSYADMSSIWGFLRNHMIEPFRYQPPGSPDAAKKWRCADVGRSPNTDLTHAVDAKLVQVWDLD